MVKPLGLWDEMRRMQEQMDSLFNSILPSEQRPLLALSNGGSADVASYRVPASDIYENDREVVAEIDMPGVDKKDIRVNITPDGIEIKAEKKHELKQDDKKKGVYRMERSYSGYYRSFSLPNTLDSDKAQAEYKDGVLRIKVPKLHLEEKKKKLLEIK